MCRVCLAFLAVLLGSACSPEMNWREWHADEAGLSQMFPCRPVRQQRTLQLAGREVLLVLHVCDAGQVSWSVAYADVADPSAVQPSLEALIEAAHVNLGAPRATAVAPAVAGASPQASAGRFKLRGRSPDARALEGEFLVFARGTWVIQVTALGARLPAESASIFLNSTRAPS